VAVLLTPERAIVLSSGEIGDPEALRTRLVGWQEALVVGADAGSLHAPALGLTLNAVIGDFDSLSAQSSAALEAQGVRVERAPAEKDETDLELALLYAARQGATRIAVLGALGGRLDMSLANVLLLAHPGLSQVRVELWHGSQTAWLIRPPGGEIGGQPGDTVSLIPLGGDAGGIETEGLVYRLHGATLRFGPARGVSNVMDSSAARVAFRTGMLLVIHTPGRA
jgi:thiamine pyrophosphokinase